MHAIIILSAAAFFNSSGPDFQENPCEMLMNEGNPSLNQLIKELNVDEGKIIQRKYVRRETDATGKLRSQTCIYRTEKAHYGTSDRRNESGDPRSR